MVKLPNLKMARYVRGLSQQQLQDLSKVHRSTIASIEMGRALATPRTSERLCRALSFNLGQLMSDKEDVLYGNDQKRTQPNDQGSREGNQLGDNADNIERETEPEFEGGNDVGSEGLRERSDRGGEPGELHKRQSRGGTQKTAAQGADADNTPDFLSSIKDGEPDFGE